MLFCNAPQPRRHLFDSRRVMAQLNLNFIDIPIPETCLWEELDDEQKQLVVETLASIGQETTVVHQ
jgi:hypothetical protein